MHCSSVDPTDAALTCKAGKSALAYRQDTQFFDLVTTWQTSTALRMETGQCVAQVVATAGLLLTVLRPPADKASSLFAAYIGAAYWFTASTSFSNPAAVLGRMFSDSFAGIAAVSASSFVVAEIVGASIGVAIAQALQEKA